MRDSYIFYSSFYEAIKELDDTDRLSLYDAINEYSLCGEIPELKGIAKALFILMKPQLDANQRRYDNGNKGGRPPKDGDKNKPNNNQTETKPKPNNNQTETKPKPNNNQTETKPKANKNDNVNDNVNPNRNNKLNQNPLSCESKNADRDIFEDLKEEEEIKILETFFFDKRFKHPLAELKRFYSHYKATGWLNANGIKIIDRAAAAKAWTNKEASLHNEEFVKNWQKIYTGLARDGDTNKERGVLLTNVIGVHKDQSGYVKISCSLYASKILDKKIQILRPILISLYGDVQGLKYIIL